MKRDFLYWLRWILVLPVAFFVWSATTELLLFFLLPTRANSPNFYAGLFGPFVPCFLFVWIGALIAPQYKSQVASALFGVIALPVVALLLMMTAGQHWVGSMLQEYGRGFGPAFAVIGAILPVMFIKRERI